MAEILKDVVLMLGAGLVIGYIGSAVFAPQIQHHAIFGPGGLFPGVQPSNLKPVAPPPKPAAAAPAPAAAKPASPRPAKTPVPPKTTVVCATPCTGGFCVDKKTASSKPCPAGTPQGPPPQPAGQSPLGAITPATAAPAPNVLPFQGIFGVTLNPQITKHSDQQLDFNLNPPTAPIHGVSQDVNVVSFNPSFARPNELTLYALSNIYNGHVAELNLNYGKNTQPDATQIPMNENFFVATYNGKGTYAMKVPIIPGHIYHREILHDDKAGTITYTVTDNNNPSATDRFSLSKGGSPGGFGDPRAHIASTFTEFHGPTSPQQTAQTGPYNVLTTNLRQIDGNKMLNITQLADKAKVNINY